MTNPRNRLSSVHVACLLVWAAVAPSAAANEIPIGWRGDYSAAREAAVKAGKPLLLWLFDPAAGEANQRFEREVLAGERTAERIADDFVAAAVSMDADLVRDQTKTRLVDHAAFAELRGGPGLAIIDFADEAAATYGAVVSIYPFNRGAISAERLAVLLDLPPGTLTQRTLIFAIRAHPDRPASAAGNMHPLLAAEAASHASHQARINLQGHHNWNARFHAINARLPVGHVSYEVCAESWPGQSLFDAAEECVDSWRQSSGHWGHVSRGDQYYGYDMQRSAGGVWYATGIFGRRR